MKSTIRLLFQYFNFLDRSFAFFRRFWFSAKNSEVNAFNAKEILNSNSSDVCHIIGGGYTATLNNGVIHSNDLVWGSSITPLSNIRHTHYFCEVYSKKNDFHKVVNKMYKELLPLLRDDNVVILHKNFWNLFNKKKEYLNLVENNDFHINEFFLRFYTNSRRKKLLNKFLKNRILFQCSASNILFLQLAKHAGCKKVVFHGVDGGGKYFIEEHEKDSSWLNNSLENEIKLFYKSTGTHLGRKSPVHDQFLVLKEISTLLDIEVYASSIESPLSNYFPIYRIE